MTFKGDKEMTKIAELRAKEQACRDEARASFERCDTDGWLSQWSNEIHAQLHSRRADIAEKGGVWTFPALFDLDGYRVRAKVINVKDRYSQGTKRVWALCDESDNFTGKFITYGLLPRNMKKRGFQEGTETAPADAKLQSSGKGLSSNVWVATVRLDKGYPDDAIVVGGTK